METQLDPRVLAEALNLDDTYALARIQYRWASEQLDLVSRMLKDDFVQYDRLARFDDFIATARKHLALAVEAEKAWERDNPL